MILVKEVLLCDVRNRLDIIPSKYMHKIEQKILFVLFTRSTCIDTKIDLFSHTFYPIFSQGP